MVQGLEVFVGRLVKVKRWNYLYRPEASRRPKSDDVFLVVKVETYGPTEYLHVLDHDGTWMVNRVSVEVVQ